MRAYIKPELIKSELRTNEEIAVGYERVGGITEENGYSVTTYSISSFGGSSAAN